VDDTIALATWHTALHAGEIAALKGCAKNQRFAILKQIC